MGIAESVRSLSPVASPGGDSRKYAKPRSDERNPRPFCSSEVQTLKDALNFINQLHKSGRMEDLASLLRRNQIFREAWLLVQRSSPTRSATLNQDNISSCRMEPAGSGDFPIPLNHELNPELEFATSGVAAEAKYKSATVIPAGADTCGNSAFQPSSTLIAALQVYKKQLCYFGQEKDPTLRISIRV
jgi:hypothetical protein